jgi:hypothetical protein
MLVSANHQKPLALAGAMLMAETPHRGVAALFTA